MKKDLNNNVKNDLKDKNTDIGYSKKFEFLCFPNTQLVCLKNVIEMYNIMHNPQIKFTTEYGVFNIQRELNIEKDYDKFFKNYDMHYREFFEDNRYNNGVIGCPVFYENKNYLQNYRDVKELKTIDIIEYKYYQDETYKKFKNILETKPNYSCEWKDYFLSCYFNPTLYVIVEKKTKKIVTYLTNSDELFQPGDCNIYVYLLCKKHILIYNYGDVNSCIIIKYLDS